MKARSFHVDEAPGSVRRPRLDSTRHPSSGLFIPAGGASVAQHEHTEKLKKKAIGLAVTEKMAFDAAQRASTSHKKAMDARMQAEKDLEDHLASISMSSLYFSGVKPGTPRKS